MKLLATTIAGSLPKPAWLAEPSQLWAPWKLDGDALAQGKRDAVRLALFDQEHAGIDIVTDGEQTRRHFVTTFIEGLDGVDFANKKTVRIRNRYDADVPMVVGPVARRHPIYVDDARFVVGETSRPVKYTLPGPMTMVDTLYDGALQEPREARVRVCGDPERGGARDRAGRRCGGPVRRAGVQRLLRRGPRLGHGGARARRGGPALQDRGPHLLRLRHQGQHRVEEDARRQVAAVRADVPPARPVDHRPGVAGMRQLARADRAHGPARRARTCWSARSTSRTSRWKPRKRWPPRSGPRCAFVPAERLLPCTNCGMVPLSREVARGKLRALAAGRRDRPPGTCRRSGGSDLIG